MKISVIVPVYNVEKYLENCIKSVINQSYKDLDIILIDDGSTDESSNICDFYKQHDSRITVLHQMNSGLSAARNAGIEISKGDAIIFLDSDDYLDKFSIEKMVSFLEKYDADISILNMKYVNENFNDEIHEKADEKISILSNIEAIEESLYQKNFTCCAPSKLYKKNVIGSIRFPVGKVSEDLATCHLFLDNADRIVFSKYYGYYYRQQPNSIMHSFNPKRLDALEWTKKIEDFCRNKYSKILPAAYCRTFNVAIHLLFDLPEKGEIHDKYIDRIWFDIKRTRLNVLFNYKVRIREKAAVICSYFGEYFLRKIWNSNIAIRKDR